MVGDRFAGIGGHHSARAKTEEWLTPPSILEALGGWQSFGLDPCAPVTRPWPTAKHHFTIEDNGLLRDWSPYGRLWCNPPYSTPKLRRWMARCAEHNNGVALIFARTETDVWHRFVWRRASALFFLEGRLTFHNVDGSLAAHNAGGPSALVAYGPADADVLAGLKLDGHFIHLGARS